MIISIVLGLVLIINIISGYITIYRLTKLVIEQNKLITKQKELILRQQSLIDLNGVENIINRFDYKKVIN